MSDIEKTLLAKTVAYDACGFVHVVELWHDDEVNWYEVSGNDITASYTSYKEAILRYKALSIDLLAKYLPSA